MTFPDESAKNNDSISTKDSNIKYIELFKKHIKQLSYEESISELETILTNVQDENISLDKIQNNYVKGHLLLKHCEELLECVEQEINNISLDSLDID